jgi:GNAT superfamily N-acetyltransferase
MVGITVIERPGKALIDAIVAPLGAYTRGKGYVYCPEDLTLALEDGGAILGGLIAQTAWSWMYVSVLAVHARLRGLGHGRALMERAEAIARRRGCIGAWVDTFSFQSPGFYLNLGYEEFGRIDDYPPGETRIFLRKAL